MGQYFLLIAPHYREKLSWGGKLGEILFDGSADSLVRLFARPIIPTKYEEEDTRNTRPPIKSTSQKQLIPQKRPRQSSNPIDMPKSRLLQLPNEIHKIIIDLLDTESVFLLGLSCSHFWTLARPEIARYFASYLGPWAGTPVICELDELGEGLEVDELEDGMPEEYAEKPVNLYRLADTRYEIVTSVSSTFPFDLFKLALDLKYKWSCPADIIQVTNPETSSFYTYREEWVLRNLTTHEFVRPSAIALDQKLIHGPFIERLGYGEVILSKICWSTHDFTSVPGNPLNQGAWAGHALDIVPATYLDDENPWKDISDKVAEEIAEIWQSTYGENWRNELLTK
ncbi:hypothetical protein ACJ72_06523 [Emergomyces africanus]|uniref:F-box domain-containing protein n=1 Tax=Emergomyces africanus TaxID=1955775 RepID=A0A1B7NQU1_9EURO|nr:hypothetical protein ACJ72_06523 [Emergomyces africanus]